MSFVPSSELSPSNEIIAKGLFRVDQVPQIISRRSAVVPVFHDDTTPTDPLILRSRIEVAVRKSFSTYDSEQFYAMQLVGSRGGIESNANDDYLRLGLYLYLADEVSRNPNQKELTLLSAMRKVGFGAIHKPWANNPTREELKQRFVEALNLLGLGHLEPVVDSWYEKNEFVINNHRHAVEGKKFWGHYTELARYMCRAHPSIMQTQLCVDYAYGNKDNVRVMNDQQILEHTEAMFFDHMGRREIIERGGERRKEHLLDIAKQKIPVISDAEMSRLDLQRAELYDKIARRLDSKIMEIVNNRGVILSYSTEQGIANIYPTSTDFPERLPGLTEKECREAKFESRSLSLTSYDLVMVSSGMPRGEQQEFSEDQKLGNAANSFTHEIFHQITNWVWNSGCKDHRGDEDTMYLKMTKLINALSERIKDGNYTPHQSLDYAPHSIEGTASWQVKLIDIINVSSPYYSGYYRYDPNDTEGIRANKSSKKCEEVAANIFALIFTEMKRGESLEDQNNAFFSEEVANEMPELKDLVELLQRFMHKGIELSKPQQQIAKA